ncbi:MAG TPA: alpha/beta fold hydrolase [Bradyrhizobium sp.]|nr:alpha/beta fold hydrolase [Bradyrhizobium sp.]
MANEEIGKTVLAAGLKTNYLEAGEGFPVVLIHGSGPGVTAFANWRSTLPSLAQRFRALAPDVAGFGYTQRRTGASYTMDFWIAHILGFLDALRIGKAHFVGNSFGGAVTLALASRYPELVERFVLMGACATEFPLTDGLDAAWGYEPSPQNMRRLMDWFAYDKTLITDDLIQHRYEASIRPGFQEAFSQMFPAPRQRHITSLATPDEQVRRIPHRVLLVHGRDDRIIPVAASIKLNELIERSELHVFGQCGHWTQIEKRERFNQLVLEFLAE